MLKTWMKTLILCLSIMPTYIFAGYTLEVTGQAGTIKADIEAEIKNKFQADKLTDLMGQMSNAQAITNKGQGVSYATDHSLFVIGSAGGVGINTTSGFNFSSNGGIPPVGVGIQGSIMVGLSLSRFPVPQIGPIDLKKLTIFANFYGYSNDSLISGLAIKTSAFGLHAQYKFIDGKNIGGIGVLNWGGVAFTSGFDVSSNTYTYKVGQKISVPSGGLTYDWTTNSTSSLSLESSSFSIPLEVSTNVRLVYILSLFAGAGIDLNFGKSTIAANLDGPLTVNGVAAGNAKLTASEEKGPSFGTLRFFAGPQINIVPLKTTNVVSIYAQGNYSIGGNYGVHAGIRIAW